MRVARREEGRAVDHRQTRRLVRPDLRPPHRADAPIVLLRAVRQAEVPPVRRRHARLHERRHLGDTHAVLRDDLRIGKAVRRHVAPEAVDPVRVLVAARKRDGRPVVRAEPPADEPLVAVEDGEVEDALRHLRRLLLHGGVARDGPLVHEARKRRAADERRVADAGRAPSAGTPLVHAVEVVRCVWRRQGLPAVAARHHARARIPGRHRLRPPRVHARGKVVADREHRNKKGTE